MKAILKYAAIAAFAIIGTYGIYSSVGSQKSEVMSDVMKANVEALGSVNPLCPDGCLTTPGQCFCFKGYALKPGHWD